MGVVLATTPALGQASQAVHTAAECEQPSGTSGSQRRSSNGASYNEGTGQYDDLQLICPLIRDRFDDEILALRVTVINHNETEEVTCEIRGWEDDGAYVVTIDPTETPEVTGIYTTHKWNYTFGFLLGYDWGRWDISCDVPRNDGAGESGVLSYWINYET
jgi:hypothetical protein